MGGLSTPALTHGFDVIGSMTVSKTVRGSSNLSTCAIRKEGAATMFNAAKYYMAYSNAMMLRNKLLPLALPAYTPHAGNPETIYIHLISWYTSGFE